MPPDDLEGTAGDQAAGDQPQADTQQAGQPGATSQAQQQPESFINPADLPEELKPHWRRMHGAYTKALERTKGAGDKAQLVDRFWSDRDFAQQTIQQWAQQMGVPISFGNGSPASAPSGGAATTTPSTADVPAGLIQAVEQQLGPELRWMAGPLAASVWKAQAHVLQPFLRDSKAKEASAKEAEYEELSAELTETAPGWETHEEDMTALLDFLQSASMRSRRWGSKLELLYKLVTGDAAAISTATRRMSDAARNRTVTGQPGRSAVDNIEERVRKAATPREAFQIAATHAADAVKRAGGR